MTFEITLIRINKYVYLKTIRANMRAFTSHENVAMRGRLLHSGLKNGNYMVGLF